MSEAKKINEGAVTSLADTDLVLATDASGTPRPLPLSHLLSLIRSNIHIGGRNLVKNSGIPVTTSEYWIKSYPYAETPEIGESIIVTIWGELGAGKSNFYVFNGNGDGTYGLSKLSKVEEGVYRGVINIGRKATAPYEIIKVYAYPQSVTGVSSTINRIKVERGNIATDWTPAPEDLGWGGVNVRYSNTYNSTADYVQKVGHHDGSRSSLRRAQISPDGHLTFRSLDATCQILGRACQIPGQDDNGNSSGIFREFGRADRNRLVSTYRFNQKRSEFHQQRGQSFGVEHMASCNNPNSVWIFPLVHCQEMSSSDWLDCLEVDIADVATNDGKEVSHD